MRGGAAPRAPARRRWRAARWCELEGLFSATPARLKFLRSDRAEAQAIGEVVRRLAHGGAGRRPSPSPTAPTRTRRARCCGWRPSRAISSTALRGRLRALLGPDFLANALPIDAERDGLQLGGFAALPTYSRGAAVAQHLFVNGRPVRDKLLLGALRAAYADLLARDRHPAAALFLACPPEVVDVNVHPAKAEVRFRDPGLVRGLVVGALQAGAGRRRASRRQHHRRRRCSARSAAGRGAAGAAPALARPAPGFAEPALGARPGRGAGRAAGGPGGRPRSGRGRCRSGWRGRRCTRPT